MVPWAGPGSRLGVAPLTARRANMTICVFLPWRARAAPKPWAPRSIIHGGRALLGAIPLSIEQVSVVTSNCNVLCSRTGPLLKRGVGGGRGYCRSRRHQCRRPRDGRGFPVAYYVIPLYHRLPTCMAVVVLHKAVFIPLGTRYTGQRMAHWPSATPIERNAMGGLNGGIVRDYSAE